MLDLILDREIQKQINKKAKLSRQQSTKTESDEWKQSYTILTKSHF